MRTMPRIASSLWWNMFRYQIFFALTLTTLLIGCTGFSLLIPSCKSCPFICSVQRIEQPWSVVCVMRGGRQWYYYTSPCEFGKFTT